MERTPIASSNLASAGYDPELEILEVEFKGAGKPVYRYRGVPQHIADEFAKAESPGSYLHTSIKGAYACKKVEAESEEG